MTTLNTELPQTLAQAARELDLFAKVADAVRTLEADPHVTHVIASPAYGEIVVIADDSTHVALKVIV